MPASQPVPYRRFAVALAGGDWGRLRGCLLSWGADAPLASLLASLWLGRSALPPRLGLRAWGLRALVRDQVPGWPHGKPLPRPARHGPACRLGDVGVAAEVADLERLLRSGRADHGPSSARLATVLAVGCMGYGHMWKDMGFASRAELRALLTAAAPRVVARNVHDMRWKKFLYRELCKSEAGYVCRAPSCDRCGGFAECFGAEE